MIDALVQDIRYGLRSLAQSPGLTLGVVLTLGLGIGANVTMFSLVDRMLFRPPPFLHAPDSTHRVYLMSTYDGTEYASSGVQYPRFVDLTGWTSSFSRTAEFAEADLAIGTGAEAREMHVGVVSASFFAFFDAPPTLGRYFIAEEDRPPSGAAVAVLGYGFWQTRYGGRRDALGTTLQIGPTLYTIIGVAPRGFVGLWPDQPPAAFIPITSHGSATAPSTERSWWTTYSWMWASMIVQRKPGVSVAAADADLTQAYLRSYAVQQTESARLPKLEVTRPRAAAGSVLSERGPDQSSFAKVATWVSGVAVIVLLIACANVANLLLARAIKRRREIAIRLALGVSRTRLLSQLFAESLLLAGLGGLAGLLIAEWGGALLRAGFLSKSADVRVVGDPRTLLFAGAAAVCAGILTGLAPALQAWRADLFSDLKAGTREGTFRRSRTRVALLVLQGALSVVLLVGAGLFVRSLQHVRAVPLGYDVGPVLLVDLNMRGERVDSAAQLALRRTLLDKARAMPGVERVTRQLTVPFWNTWNVGLYVAGIDSVSRLGRFDLNAVTPDYFATMGTRILRGCAISAEDSRNAPRVMVVSAAMAKALWPGQDPIGRCVKVSADTAPCTYVVGVAENIKEQQLSNDPGLFYYMSSEQWYPQHGGLFVRIRGEAARHAEPLRRLLQQAMPGASYVTVTPLHEIISGQTRSWQLGATMFLVFGALAVALAAIGLYSVIAYSVAQRTHELGVRAVLGAQFGDVVRLVVGEGLGHGVTGVAIGVVLALIGGRWVGPLLFEQSPRDPFVFGFVIAVLLGVAALASYLPARRAAKVDPMVALRYE